MTTNLTFSHNNDNMTNVPWAPDFEPPSKEQVDAAVGVSPCRHDESRRDALTQHSPSAVSSSNLDQVNNVDVFRLKQVQDLQPPRDDGDWLACYNEEGQTFDDYVRDITFRSGRFRSFAGVDRHGGIVLVPIVQESWSPEAPPIQELARFVQAFFHGTPVHVSNTPAIIKKVSDGCKQQDWMEWKPPTEYVSAPERLVACRESHDRLQVSAESLLTCLTDLTDGTTSISDDSKRPFCVVGITYQDLFSATADLFIAGLTAGRSHVAVLSLFRYHPHLKMSPKDWWKYGYTMKSSCYLYFEPDANVEIISKLERPKKRKRHLQLLHDLPEAALSYPATKREMLRRAVKLLCHEILHIYQLDHCIFHKCLMNGTGHLVEDFAAPAHLCGVDLRKLQFRLGFDVSTRFGDLATVWESWGCKKEAKWYRQREKEAKKILDLS